MHLLQVCNVGRIVGGTAACAWTVAQSLPAFEHTVVFRSRPDAETRAAFSRCRVQHASMIDSRLAAANEADVVLLHNTPRSAVRGPLPAVTLQYLHSRITPADADATLYCSRHLARAYRADQKFVCHQAVPKPIAAQRPRRSLRPDLVIGRICTPQSNKWPPEAAEVCAQVVESLPRVRWELVGCPQDRRSAFAAACRGNVSFHDASWQARSRYWQWDALVYHNPHVTESFGRTAAEAMRAGCLPVVDRRGGFVEQVPAGCGFLCETPQVFVETLGSLQEPALRWRMSRAAEAHADSVFGLNRFGGELLEWFDRAARGLNRRSKTRARLAAIC